MKKFISVFLSILLCTVFLAGCNTNSEKTAEISGEIYDAGNLSVLVPKGWMAIPVNNMWSDEADAVDPNQLRICKGAKSEWDIFSYPSVDIVYYDSDTDMLIPSRELYHDVVELETVTVGDKIWEGFTGTISEKALAILWTGENGTDQFQVAIWLKADNDTINIEDTDVQAILASIQPSS